MSTATFAQLISLIPAQPVSIETVPDLAPAPADDRSTLGLVELILKNTEHVDRLTADETRQPWLVTRFLAVSLVGYTCFGVAATVMLNTAAEWPRGIPAARWTDWSMLNLTLAYDLGLIAAIGVVLPSFYFYSLLAGVRTTFLQVTTHALKANAVAAMKLLGILPIYVAVILGMIVFGAPPEWTRWTLYFALALPFVAGLVGVRSLYVGFVRVAEGMAVNWRCRRECFLRRLVLSWAACGAVVTPLMIYTLWSRLSG